MTLALSPRSKSKTNEVAEFSMMMSSSVSGRRVHGATDHRRPRWHAPPVLSAPRGCRGRGSFSASTLLGYRFRSPRSSSGPKRVDGGEDRGGLAAPGEAIRFEHEHTMVREQLAVGACELIVAARMRFSMSTFMRRSPRLVDAVDLHLHDLLQHHDPAATEDTGTGVDRAPTRGASAQREGRTIVMSSTEPLPGCPDRWPPTRTAAHPGDLGELPMVT